MGHGPTIVRTNSLIILLPKALFAPALLSLFQAHFASSYGALVSWTPLERLGRVLVVYETVASAVEAKLEMDGFVWEEEEESQSRKEGIAVVASVVEGETKESNSAAGGSNIPVIDDVSTPIRVFFGPALSLPLQSLHQTLLAVPALSKNFLISPPGSPPVGWEQTLEEKPNMKSHHDGEESWAGELERALRFLSVSVEDDGSAVDDEETVEVENGGVSLTHTIIPPTTMPSRPAVTLSTPLLPPASSDISENSTATPPPGATKIGNVKATIESMLGRRKSFGASLDTQGLQGGGGLGGGVGNRIVPTARPPTEEIDAYRFDVG